MRTCVSFQGIATLTQERRAIRDPEGPVAWGRVRGLRAIGSVVERSLHTREVTGSNPVSPTESPHVRRCHVHRDGPCGLRTRGDRCPGQRTSRGSGHAGGGGRRRRGCDGRFPRGSRCAAALGRPHHGPGGPGPLPPGKARHRPTDQGRVLLRVRRPHGVHPGGPCGDREADGRDREIRPGVPAPCGERDRGGHRVSG